MINNKNKQEIQNWIKEQKPTHFLTIQFKINLRSSNYEKSKNLLYKYMVSFERILKGRHWNRHHLEFICFAERNSKRDNCWHYHILLCGNKNDTTENISKALSKLKTKKDLCDNIFDLQEIIRTPDKLYNYCMKHFDITLKGRVNTDKFITSWDLFNLPYKSNSK